MKNLLLLLFIPLCILGCTRNKEILRDDILLAELPPHCYNKVRDIEEDGIDCGGPCVACNMITPTCTTTNDQAVFDGKDYHFTDVVCSLENGKYKVKFKLVPNNSGEVFDGEMLLGSFNLSLIYSPRISVFYLDEVYIELDSPLLNLRVREQAANVFVGVENGKKYVVFCNVLFKKLMQSTEYTLTGKMLFNC